MTLTIDIFIISSSRPQNIWEHLQWKAVTESKTFCWHAVYTHAARAFVTYQTHVQQRLALSEI